MFSNYVRKTEMFGQALGSVAVGMLMTFSGCVMLTIESGACHRYKRSLMLPSSDFSLTTSERSKETEFSRCRAVQLFFDHTYIGRQNKS